MNIRTIDAKRLFAANFTRTSLREEIVESFNTTGFLIIDNVKEGLSMYSTVIKENVFDISDFRDAWLHNFFYMPESYKNKLKFKTKENSKQVGYFPIKSETAKEGLSPDLKEFYQMYLPNHAPHSLREISDNISHHLLMIGHYILEALSSDLKINLTKMTNHSDSQTMFRVIYYPETQEDTVRAAAHEDINFITLLPGASSSGLQILGKDGSWIDAPLNDDSVIINIGDMLQMLSGGKYKSTTHRVVGKEERVSSPLFIHPHPDTDLGPMTAKQYLDERLRELGLL